MKDAYQCSPIPIIITYRNHNRNEEKLTSSTPQPLPYLYHTPKTTLLHPPYLCHAHLTLPLLQPYHIPTLTLPQPTLTLPHPYITSSIPLIQLYHTYTIPFPYLYLHLTTPQPQSYITPTIAFPHLTLILPHYTTPLPYLYHTLTVTLPSPSHTIPHPYRTSTTPLPYLNHTPTTTLPHLYHTLLRTPFIGLNYILYYCIANRPIYSIQYMGFDICIQIFGYLSLMESLHKGNRGEKL